MCFVPLITYYPRDHHCNDTDKYESCTHNLFCFYKGTHLVLQFGRAVEVAVALLEFQPAPPAVKAPTHLQVFIQCTCPQLLACSIQLRLFTTIETNLVFLNPMGSSRSIYLYMRTRAHKCNVQLDPTGWRSKMYRYVYVFRPVIVMAPPK